MPFDAIVILAIIALNAVLGYVQEARAEEAASALQRMAAPTAGCGGTAAERIRHQRARGAGDVDPRTAVRGAGDLGIAGPSASALTTTRDQARSDDERLQPGSRTAGSGPTSSGSSRRAGAGRQLHQQARDAVAVELLDPQAHVAG